MLALLNRRFLRRWFRATQGPLQRRGRTVSLLLEELEDRTVPSAGQLDTSFGTDGKAPQPASTLAVQTDGKIVLASGAANSTGTGTIFGAERLNSDGSLDTTFGNGGKQTIDFQVQPSGEDDVVSSVAIQPDGKIVLAGWAPSPQNNLFAVARLNTDGSLDTSFGTNGKVTVNFPTPVGSVSDNDPLPAMVLQPDGKIVMVGTADASGRPSSAFAVIRLNTDGTLDPTFGTGGEQTVDFTLGGTQDIQAMAVAMQGNNIVLGGSGTTFNNLGVGSIDVARLTPAGSLDTSFGSGGMQSFTFEASANPSDKLYGMAVQADGKILLAGSGPSSANTPFDVARLNANGSVDSTYGNAGVFQFLFPFPQGDANFPPAVSMALQLQSDGKAVVVGEVVIAPFVGGSHPGSIVHGGITDYGVARVITSGALDPTFGDDGLQLVADAGGATTALAIQSDGKILIAGNPVAVVRLLNDGQQNAGQNDELGAYRPSDGSWSLDSDGTLGFNPATDQVFFNFSPPNVTGVAGDWTGSGHTDIGDFSNGTWHLDLNGNGVLDPGETFTFGQAGDIPVVGDWNGDGKTDLGVFRAAPDGITGEFILDTNEDHVMVPGDETFTFGLATDRIVVGDWNGAGKSKVGVFRDAASYIPADAGDAVFSLDSNNNHAFDASDQVFVFGLITDGVVIGDWNGSGTSKVGVYRPAAAFGAPNTAVFSLDTTGALQFTATSQVFLYGNITDQFVTGNWAPTPPLLPQGTPQAELSADGVRRQ